MEVSKTSAQKLAIIFLALAILLLLTTPPTAQTNMTAPHPNHIAQSPPVTAQVSITPNVTDTSIRPGTQLNFTVSIANSPPLNGFNVYVKFDPRVLTAGSAAAIDPTGNIIYSTSSDVFVQSECINLQAAPGGGCTNSQIDGLGVVNLGMTFKGNLSTPNNTSGILYRLKLTVNDPSTEARDPGATQLQLAEVDLSPANANMTKQAVPSNNSDAFFTNRNCSGTAICTPPYVNLTWTPPLPSIGTNITFSASGSRPTNLNAKVYLYQWNWGGEICHAVASIQVVNQTIVGGVLQPPNPTIYHEFCNAQTYAVTLLVNDTFGITWALTKLVPVQYIWIDTTFSGITVDNKFNVIPGTIVHISSSVVNNSTLPAPATLTITLDTGKVLASQSFNLTARGSTFGSSAKVGPVAWNTTGYPVRSYRINLVVSSEAPFQNLTGDKRVSAFVQLIQPQPPGGLLSLGLLQSSGLSILIIIALFVGLNRFRRKPHWETEPLQE